MTQGVFLVLHLSQPVIVSAALQESSKGSVSVDNAGLRQSWTWRAPFCARLQRPSHGPLPPVTRCAVRTGNIKHSGKRLMNQSGQKPHNMVGVAVRRSLLAAAAIAGGVLPPSIVYAADDPMEEVVVTGSILRRTDTETPSPVTVLSSESLEQRGINTIAEAVQRLSLIHI